MDKFSMKCIKNLSHLGSGCGTVDSMVASDARGPGFEYSHRQLLPIYQVFSVR